MRQPLTPEQWLELMLTRFERELIRLNVSLSPKTGARMDRRIEQLRERVRARIGTENRMD